MPFNAKRWPLAVLGGLVGALVAFFKLLELKLSNTQQLTIVTLIVAIGIVVGALIQPVVHFFTDSLTSFKLTGMEFDLRPIRAERKEIEQRIASRDRTQLDIFSVIQLGLNQINEYYTINKSQARNSFRVSMGAMVVGLLALSIGIVLNYKQPQHTTVPTLSAISGVLLQFIGGAYFYLYNRTLQQLNFFYETLVRLQDTMLAVQQVDQLEGDVREKAREAVIKALIRAPVVSPRVGEIVAKKPRGKAQAAATSA